MQLHKSYLDNKQHL